MLSPQAAFLRFMAEARAGGLVIGTFLSREDRGLPKFLRRATSSRGGRGRHRPPGAGAAGDTTSFALKRNNSFSYVSLLGFVRMFYLSILTGRSANS